MIGTRLKGIYRLIEEKEHSDLMTLYLAEDESSGSLVDIKVINPGLGDDDKFLKQFQREAQALSFVSSPHVIRLIDYGIEGNAKFIVLECAVGKTLAEVLRDTGPQEVNKALEITYQVAACLAEVSSRGLVHRDIRPENILLAPGNVVKVMNFGVAAGTNLNRLTMDGLVGDANYMAPEIAEGSNVDYRVDIYSLGVVLFEMISGEVPYHGDTAIDIALKHLREPIPRLSERLEEVPLEVDQIVQKCMAKSPNQRYSHASELLGDIARITQPPVQPNVMQSPLAAPSPVGRPSVPPPPVGQPPLAPPPTGRPPAPPPLGQPPLAPFQPVPPVGVSPMPADPQFPPRPASNAPFLVMAVGPQPGQRIALTGTVIVGRDPTSHIILDDAWISRRHAQFTVQGNQLVLTDLGSSNGTSVNGVRLTSPRALAAGDRVGLGHTEWVVEMPAISVPSTPPPPVFQAPPPAVFASPTPPLSPLSMARAWLPTSSQVPWNTVIPIAVVVLLIACICLVLVLSRIKISF